MPTVYQTGSFKITLYFRDHAPPHFHVVGRGFEALVAIETLTVMEGGAPKPALRAALNWAKKNKVLLLAKWEEMHP